MRMLWICLLLSYAVWAEVSQEISRACRRDPKFYQACIANLEGQYRPGWRAFDLFAYLEKPGPVPLKTGSGALVETGFALDLALDGPGFFVLSGGKLLRSGAFRLHQGRLCTEQGVLLLSSPRLQPLELEDESLVTVTSEGEVRYVRTNGDGKYDSAGQLAIARVAHPQWLRADGPILTPTPASGPPRIGRGATHVLSHRLELGNASPLEQQKTCRGVFAFAGLGSEGTSARARRDLLRLIAEHDRRCAATLENLKHLTDSGHRANDIFTIRLRVSPGPLRETKDPYNLAIDGEGYFVLSNGLLSRDGSFEMNRDGYLVSHDGLQLMGSEGPLQIPADMSNLEVKGDGTVMATRLNGDGKPQRVDQIPLARVRDGAYLQRSGTHLRTTALSGPPRLDTPGKNGRGVIAQGYLESTNLSAIDQIKMLHALRNYAHLLGMPLADDYQP